MGIGGLYARMLLLLEQMKKQPCARCGLHYDHKEHAHCPWCGELDAAGLARLLERRENEHQANRQTGLVLWIVAAALFIIMLIGLS